MTNHLKDSELSDSSGGGAAVGRAAVGLQDENGRGRPATGTGNPDAMSATKESLEDYTLRFAPRSYRKWECWRGGDERVWEELLPADFSIESNIGIAYGTVNAILGIVVAAVIIFATVFPLAYYAARYNIDLDLIARGSGFG